MLKNLFLIIFLTVTNCAICQDGTPFLIIDNETSVVIEYNNQVSTIICNGCRNISFDFNNQNYIGVINNETIEFIASNLEEGKFTFKIDRIEYLNANGQSMIFSKINDHQINIIENDLTIELQKIGSTYSVKKTSNQPLLSLIQLAIILAFDWL